MSTTFFDRPRRFMLVLNDLRMGGAERHAILLSRQLKLRGHQPIILGLASPGAVLDECRERNIDCHYEPFEDPLKNPFELQHAEYYARKMRRLLCRYRPEVLLPCTSLPNVYCGIAWRRSPVKLCVWNQLDAGLYRLNEALEERAARSSSGFLSNSQVGAEFLTTALKILPSRMKIIHNGVEVPKLMDRLKARESLGLKPYDFVGAMLGNIRPIKDHATLLEAWQRVVDRQAEVGRRPILLLAGEVDASCEYLRQRTEQGPLAEYVRFLGFQSDIGRVLSAADVGLFSSHSEGLPNGVLECLGAGLPMVATDLPGIRECMPPSQVAHLVAPGQAEPFAERIVQLSNRATGTDDGRSNRHWIQDHFTVEVLAAKTLAALAGFKAATRSAGRLSRILDWLGNVGTKRTIAGWRGTTAIGSSR